MWARYYDPRIGRFIQRGPIAIDGGLNAYAYAIDRPTSLVGPTGHEFSLAGQALAPNIVISLNARLVVDFRDYFRWTGDIPITPVIGVLDVVINVGIGQFTASPFAGGVRVICSPKGKGFGGFTGFGL